jgi:acyl carrier protein
MNPQWLQQQQMQRIREQQQRTQQMQREQQQRIRDQQQRMREQQQQIQDDLYRRKQEEWYRLQQQQKQLELKRVAQSGQPPFMQQSPGPQPVFGHASRKTMARVQRIVADQLGVNLREVVPEANLFTDLGADDLDMVELVMALEEAFNIEIPDDVLEYVQTPSDIAGYIDEAMR